MAAATTTTLGLPPGFAFSREYREEESDIVIKAANAYRMSVSAPYQSDFRVLAVLVYHKGSGYVKRKEGRRQQQQEVKEEEQEREEQEEQEEEEEEEGPLQHIVGHNCESCQIANSICAERSAIAQLGGRHAYTRLIRIYIVTDSAEPLSPGMLCREFLSSLSDGSLHIVLGSSCSSIIKSVRLSDLYPYPSIYRHTVRSSLLETGQRFVRRGMQRPSVISQEAEKLYHMALQATERDDRDHLHPLRYAAAALFSDGTCEVAWQKKGLEYGTTLDAVSQLAQLIESKSSSSKQSYLSFLVHVDNLGICHGPVSTARAYLQEYGHGHAYTIIHDESDGVLHRVRLSALAPDAPVIFDDSSPPPSSPPPPPSSSSSSPSSPSPPPPPPGT